MKDTEKKRAETLALFRHGLIADRVHRQKGEAGLSQILHERAQRSYCIPGSTRTHVAEETLRDWLKKYRLGGFEALLPKPRCDAGQSRTMPQPAADILLSLKEAHPTFSVEKIILAARQAEPLKLPSELVLPRSTVHRLFSKHGLMEKKCTPVSLDHRRFAFQKAGDLWMSDVMHGPAVPKEGGRKCKTYLIAFLDDATRVIPFAAFAFAETRCLLPSRVQTSHPAPRHSQASVRR